MYLKISEGTVSIGEAQIRATISGQGLAAGLGDWNGRININENIGFVKFVEEAFVTDVYKDTFSVVFPARRNSDFTQVIGDIAIMGQSFGVDEFSDRTWITEILRTYVLTSVRGNPKYGNYLTINNEERFTLRKRYAIESAPESLELGYMECLVVDTAFYDAVEDIQINGYTAGFRQKFTVTTAETFIEVPDTVETINGKYELKATTQELQVSEAEDIDEGYLEKMTIDISAFDGVKGVQFEL